MPFLTRAASVKRAGKRSATFNSICRRFITDLGTLVSRLNLTDASFIR